MNYTNEQLVDMLVLPIYPNFNKFNGKKRISAYRATIRQIKFEKTQTKYRIGDVTNEQWDEVIKLLDKVIRLEIRYLPIK
jgi:hypothetical protein